MQLPENQITKLLSSDKAVKGLFVIGSHAQSGIVPDAWSDLDLVVVVEDESAGRFYPHTEWIAQFGEVYALAVSGNEHFGVVRVQYADASRVDFVIVPEASLESVDHWAQNPLRFERRCLFSRSPLLDQVLQRRFAERVVPTCSVQQLEQMANDFRFKAMLAAAKVARNELLVSTHLGLDLTRDCLVLAMMLRDQVTGTDHHRDGRQGNHLVESIGQPVKEYTALELLSSIERNAAAFGSLALQLNDRYKDRSKPLFDYIARVRKSLALSMKSTEQRNQ